MSTPLRRAADYLSSVRRRLEGISSGENGRPIDGRSVAAEPATVDDVYHCYRLFLQRHPDPVGFGAYADQVTKGLTVKDLVGYFVGCPEWIDRGLFRTPANSALRLVETSDFPIYVIAADPVVARELIATRQYEPHLAERLKRHLRAGWTFVDVGANVGYYSLLAAQQVGIAGRVIAFEPNADNIKALALNKMIGEVVQVDIRPFAVSDERGLLSLMKIVSIGSTRKPTADDLKYLTDAALVYAVTLDDALREESRVDVIKCDIDGHDYRAFAGAREVLKRFRPTIVAEFNPGTLRTFSGVDSREYLDLFLAEGYDLAVVLRSGEEVDCGRDPTRVLELIDRTGADQVDLWLRHPSRSIEHAAT